MALSRRQLYRVYQVLSNALASLDMFANQLAEMEEAYLAMTPADRKQVQAMLDVQKLGAFKEQATTGYAEFKASLVAWLDSEE